jgi:hypothetical protein
MADLKVGTTKAGKKSLRHGVAAVKERKSIFPKSSCAVASLQ